MSYAQDVTTSLIDPQSNTTSRCVFRIEPGRKFLTRKLRLCNFGLSNSSGNSANGGDGVYFGHKGVYSLISKISVSNTEGTEIDRLQGNGLEMMGIRLSQMSNSAEFAVGRQLSQQMCNSIFVQSFSQTTLTETARKDDATLMGNSLYIDISAMLTYLMARNISDEGLVIQIEWTNPSALGYSYSFNRPPVLAVDYVLNPTMMVDEGDEFGFISIVDDRVLLTTNSIDRRLQSYFNQYLNNLYYFNIGRSANLLGLPLSRPQERFELTVNGRKILTLNGIDSDAKKLDFLNMMSSKTNITHYASYVNGVTSYGLYNPNLGLDYSFPKSLSTAAGSVFSWGCVQVDQLIGSDLVVQYSTSLAQGGTSPADSDTLVFLAEILRSYNKRTGLVRYIGV
tara:strand:+ start:8914 stop:10098 length:1185 start_codon:yes stop_codon:yes gene_type:complete